MEQKKIKELEFKNPKLKKKKQKISVEVKNKIEIFN